MTASRQFDFSTRLFKRNLHAPVAPASIAVARFSLSNQVLSTGFPRCLFKNLLGFGGAKLLDLRVEALAVGRSLLTASQVGGVFGSDKVVQST
jgi:hypothetical protein